MNGTGLLISSNRIEVRNQEDIDMSIEEDAADDWKRRKRFPELRAQKTRFEQQTSFIVS